MNSHRDYWGYCSCNEGYYGHDCGEHHGKDHYAGYCSGHCDKDCYGPNDYDCGSCSHNAYKDSYGYCNCQHGYYGDYCDLSGDDYYMDDCEGHSHRDEYSHCCCDQYWEGDDCSIYVYYEYDSYMGPCDPICNGCTGSDPTECEVCVHNAHWSD
jgi:hypothetical protein